MKNEMFFENGIRHEFTDDEIRMLKVCILKLANDKQGFYDSLAKICPQRYDWGRYENAMKQLYSLFIDNLD